MGAGSGNAVQPMRVLVIGAGAVGGYFGARMVAAGRDVSFLVREGRAEQLRRSGLQVVSPFGDVTVHPKLLLKSELREPFDLILLSTKAYSLRAAMEDFAPAVGAHTAILPLLNGIGHLDVLAERFGKGAVLGGSTRIVADLDADGRVHQMERLQDLVYGELDGARNERMQRIEATLDGCGFAPEASDNVLKFMWQKWVLLASLGGLTCLMRGSIGEIAAVPGGADVARALIAECAAIASAEGYAAPADFLQMTARRLTKPRSELTASMYRDLCKGAPVEADHILGDLLRRGQAHGLQTPVLQAAFVQLSVYGARRESESSATPARG